MPMTSDPINAAALLARGLRTDFLNLYETAISREEEGLDMLMDLKKESDGSHEDYVHPQDPPRFRRKPKHQAIAVESLRFLSWRTLNHTWTGALEWHTEDEQDDQTRSLPGIARTLADGAAEVPGRINWQLRLGTANADLLPTIPNAPDGAAVYSATDGNGAARYGVTGGNIVAATGVTTAEQIRTDFFSCEARFINMTTPKGRRRWTPAVLRQGYTISFGPNLNKVMREAFRQEVTESRATTVVTSGAPVIAGVSNVTREFNVDLNLTHEITTNNWYIDLKGASHKPVYRQNRLPMQDNLYDFENSDYTRTTFLRRLQFWTRAGYGAGDTAGTIAVQ